MKLSWLKHPLTIVSSVVLGILIGFLFPDLAAHLKILGYIFLALLKMAVVPLMVTAISSCFAKAMSNRALKRKMVSVLLVFIVSLLLASAFGMLLGVLMNARHTISYQSLQSLMQAQHSVATPVVAHQNLAATLKSFLPSNIFYALSTDNNLAILIFSVIFGLSLGFVSAEKGAPLINLLDALFEAFMKLVDGALYFLPFALISIMADQFAKSGSQLLTLLAAVIIYTYVGCIIISTLGFILLAKRLNTPLLPLIKRFRSVFLTAFFTSSSYASLPHATFFLKKRPKINKAKLHVFLPLSISLNPAGGAFFFGLIIMFMMNLFHLPLSLFNLLFIWVGACIASIAIGAVPAIAGFSILGMVLTPLNIPLDITLALLVAIAQFVDPIFTVTNITWNCVISSFFATKDYQFRKHRFQHPVKKNIKHEEN